MAQIPMTTLMSVPMQVPPPPTTTKEKKTTTNLNVNLNSDKAYLKSFDSSAQNFLAQEPSS